MPPNHLPLGPLKPNAQTRAPPPQENSSRWRTQLARGAEARAYEAAETEFVTRLLAFMVQNNLEDYKKINPEFGVSVRFFIFARHQKGCFEEMMLTMVGC